MPKRQDIVLLVLDTQRVDRLSCYGYRLETSPNIDELAADATLFDQAISAAQWTIPSHASMFTGLYPTQHTVYQMSSLLPPTIETMAERLARSGYFTAGYSHNPLIGMVDNGLTRGFNQFSNYRHIGAGLLANQFSQPQEEGNVYSRLKRSTRFLLAEILGYSQSSPLHRLSPIASPVWLRARRFTSGSKVAKIRKSLAAATALLVGRKGIDQEQPVFVFINLMGTHVPYEPSSSASKRFISDEFGSDSERTALQRANNWQADIRNWIAMEDLGDVEMALLGACYDAEVASQDAEVGRFISDLRQSGALENTLFILVADHGDHLGDKQRVNHAFGVYNALTRVPLLIRDPAGRLPRGSVISDFVSTRRIFHTVLAAADVAIDGEENLSLGELNQDENGVVLAEGHALEWALSRIEKSRPGLAMQYGCDRPARALFTGSDKLIVTGERRELYEVRFDPGEEADLALERPEEVSLRAQLLEETIHKILPVTEDLQVEEIDQSVIQHLRDLGYLE